MLSPIYLIIFLTAALKSIAMRIISSIRPVNSHKPPRKPNVTIPNKPNRKSKDAWSVTSTPFSAFSISPSPFPTTSIPEFRPKSLEQRLPSPTRMASLDITRSREGAPLAPHCPAPGALCTWPPNLTKCDMPHDSDTSELNISAQEPPFFSLEKGLWLSARKIVNAPATVGNSDSARAAMDMGRDSVFEDVPLTPPPVRREDGAQASMLMVIWRWICEWVLGWGRRRVGRRTSDLEAGRRNS